MAARLPYEMEDGLLYQTHKDGSCSLCLPRSFTKEIFKLVHHYQAHQRLDAA